LLCIEERVRNRHGSRTTYLYYDASHTGWHKRPDWFAVLGTSRHCRQRDLRLCYVIWQEEIAPYIVVELLSAGTEDEDLGKTLWDVDGPPGKWAVYEQLLKVPYYAVYSRYDNELRAFRLVSDRYRELTLPNRRLWLPEARIGLGVWSGRFEGIAGDWLRCYDTEGHWLPTKSERQEQASREAEQERLRAEQASRKAEQADRKTRQEHRRAEQLAARLRALGIDPDRES
jgi:Uma2 family endonuclease